MWYRESYVAVILQFNDKTATFKGNYKFMEIEIINICKIS